MISVVIPARNETTVIGDTLAYLHACTPPGLAEFIVAVGGSTDGTAEAAQTLARVVEGSDSSRSGLLNTGAQAARGTILFFLHADSLPPMRYAEAIVHALADQTVSGGAFYFEFREQAWHLGAIAALNRLRCRTTGNFYGDQGLFVRRTVFTKLGGFPRRLLFEDLVFSQMMRRHGRTVLLRGQRVRTSGRRFLDAGWPRTVGLMTWLLMLHALGADTDRYAAVYHRRRVTRTIR
jgi:rSAM/selenodomain-associated transferase 2